MRTSMFAKVVLTVGLVACAGISVTTDFDPDVDLTQYETFAWMEGSGSAGGDIRATGDLVDQRFRRAIESELASRGLQKATSGAPDMFVGYQLALDDKVDYQTMNTYYGHRPAIAGRRRARPAGGNGARCGLRHRWGGIGVGGAPRRCSCHRP